MRLPGLPADYTSTRAVLQRVAAHVVARRRAAVTGRFGLRVTPGGIGTPMFGDDEVVRLAGAVLVHERRVDDQARTTTAAIDGASLSGLAALVDVMLDEDFSVGHDTPALGDADAPLVVGADASEVLGGWFAFGARAVDRAVAGAGAGAAPSVPQVWPEHFDLGVDLASGPTRTNLGASPGDGFSNLPYLYVGPWSDARPGDAAYWNAPFGAVLTYDALGGSDDPDALADEFFARGIARLGDTASG